jgi:hypothetical protein
MRATAAFFALTLPVLAESGPPTTAEIAEAKADCAAEVRQDCLILLATEIALANPEATEAVLNDIAFAQATLGDRAAAERTLALTTPGFPALAALGREEEAAAALKAKLEKAGLEVTEAQEPVTLGSTGELALNEVKQQLKAGDVDRALKTALSISENDHVSKPKALRAIVDHHIAAGDFAAALLVAKNLEPEAALAEMFHELTAGYNDPHSDALAAVATAQAATGDLDGAALLAASQTAPRARVSAHLALARIAFEAGKTDLAKAQLDLVLSGVRDLEPALVFGTMTLTQSADLALLHGQMDIARDHAEAAYRIGTRPSIRRGGEGGKTKPSNIILLQLATVLHLVGSTEKATALYDRAAVPYKEEPFSTLRSSHLAALLVAQIQLGDEKGAAETKAMLVAMDGIAWEDGKPFLHMAALSLIELGFLKQALDIADLLEPELRRDLLGFHGEGSAALYAAILTKDPDLAPEVLKDSLGAGAHFKASLALARSLSAAGRIDEARAVLNALPVEHERRVKADDKFHFDPVCVVAFIALTQDEIGLSADAAASRQQGLALARAKTAPTLQAGGLLIVASSFPQNDAGSMSFAFGCIEYHP